MGVLQCTNRAEKYGQSDKLENNMKIDHKLAKDEEENCWLVSDEHFYLDYSQKYFFQYCLAWMG